MIIEPAKRTSSVKEYFFSRKQKELDALNAERAARGEDRIISLGIGAPDGMPPLPAIEALVKAAPEPGNHVYQNYKGLPVLRQAFADWYSRYYGVTLDPGSNIQPLVGSKEGILLISLTFVNPGDKVLVPDPGYPTYTSSARLAGAEILTYDLLEENHWWPDFDALERMDLEGVKVMWTNYPNMPTGAKATPEIYQRLVDFGLRHKILIVNDNPYSFILTDKPLSILAVPRAMECCLELNSLSKSHNMSGWRIGMVAGAPEMISEILKVKSQMDSGMFKPLQLAAVEALNQSPEWFAKLNSEYVRRRVAAGRIFDTLGAVYDHDTAGLFLWGRVPSGYAKDGMSAGEVISERVLHQAGVFITPGFIFGKNGENYIRVSLCATTEVLEAAERRIRDNIQSIKKI
ncbi:MAG: aminotransferase class I/II-fold pyridoxal phosphate-dependent enzyme [Candidatus Cryptobacteroides sp.]|uniref:pyridoxal phosphate-dependent aminotransferase n=1 Tax=Candidatus Cryptobacteroides bacterium TaxID=3085639 RepID=UPI00033D8FBD|nr:aminotransferase class I/II-fold pyridoxal phosphate-dependent enzyme [Alistipes sp.]MDY4726416.1 aminotransferase class I/II-fold pyridoxal phosphate-dependent enzyme [Candidatus Cryptobacteroides sp.]MDY5200360.1 aminotransferase class I/II-fold pyridoxal phosphate-dependent enzyme [Candidatus Cryptobacteroides sp.]CCX52157.1 lL-diaminopimelate aminotransferase [Alistipes sp. CAG:514]